jgi:putative lipoic acid-binding regulatory protein
VNLELPREGEPSPIEYPCDFPLKILGHAQPGYAQAVLAVVKRHAPDFDDASLALKTSKKGKYLSVMPAAQQQLRGKRAGQREKHVPLGVPDVALGGEKLVRVGTDQQRRPPFDQFVERADRQRHAKHQEKQDFPAADAENAQQQLARHHCRHETLGQMAQPVVGVARKSQQFLHPETGRSTRIGIGAAVDQDQSVDRDQHIDQRGQRQTPAAGE